MSKHFFSEDDYEQILDVLLENQKQLIERKYKKKYFLSVVFILLSTQQLAVYV